MKSLRTGLIKVLLFGTMTVVLSGCGETATLNQPTPTPAPAQTSPRQSATPAQAPTQAPAATTAVKADGKDIFANNCASCHGAGGVGATGPALNKANLSIGAKTPASVLALIKEGKIAKGMPAWQNVLSDDDLSVVSDYVVSLK